jgi:hypothetical protein
MLLSVLSYPAGAVAVVLVLLCISELHLTFTRYSLFRN